MVSGDGRRGVWRPSCEWSRGDGTGCRGKGPARVPPLRPSEQGNVDALPNQTGVCCVAEGDGRELVFPAVTQTRGGGRKFPAPVSLAHLRARIVAIPI